MKGKQGFASMDPSYRKLIAAMGGKAAHRKGTAHTWDRSEAKIAGEKGAKARLAKQSRAAKPT